MLKVTDRLQAELYFQELQSSERLVPKRFGENYLLPQLVFRTLLRYEKHYGSFAMRSH